MHLDRQLVRSISVFERLSDADADAVAARLVARRLAPGEQLFAQGQHGRSLAIVLGGALVRRARTEHGADVDLGRAGQGELVGEMACVDPAPRAGTIVADGNSFVAELLHEDLLTFRDSAPGAFSALLGRVLHDVSTRLIELDRRILRELGAGAAAPSSAPAPAAAREDSGLWSLVDRSRGAVPDAPVSRLRPFEESVGFAPDELSMLEAATTPRRYAPGATVLVRGKPAASCLFVAEGELDVMADDDGRGHAPLGVPLATLGPGAIVGQVALLTNGTRSHTVRARTDAVALELSRDAFDQLLRARTPFAVRFQQAFTVAAIRQYRSALAGLLRLADRAHPEAKPEGLRRVRAATLR